MQGQGVDAVSARQMALSLLDNEISRQAGMMAYNYLFLLVTTLFIISMPFIFLLKSIKKQTGIEEIIVE